MLKIYKYICSVILIMCFFTSQAQVVWNGRSNDPDSLIGPAIAYMKAEKLERSILLCRTVLDKYPTYVDFKYILGLNYQKMGRFDWSLPYLEEVVQQSPEYKDAYPALIQAYRSLGKKDLSLKFAKIAFEKFPKDSLINALHQDIVMSIENEKMRTQIADLYKKAELASGEKDWSLFSQYIDSLSKMDSSSRRLPLLRAELFRSQKRYQQAISQFDKVIQEGDTSSFIYEQLAGIAAEQKNYSDALYYVEKLLINDPENDQYRQLKKMYEDNYPYKNYIGLSHTQISYDRPHGHYFISGIEYGRRIKAKNMLIGKVNYGDRRGDIGVQLGLDAWITYSSKYYSYNHLSWSDALVFPKWRAAYSIYHEVNDWQFDLGGRYLLTQDNMQNYGGVASIGKYIGPTFVYFRTFILKDDYRWNQAYSLSARHYYNEEKQDSYVTIIGNIGTSPDDPERYLYLNNSSSILSRSINAGWQHRIQKWVFGIMGGWSYYRITDQQYMNQYDLNLSLKKYF